MNIYTKYHIYTVYMYVCIKRKSDEDSHSNKTIEEGIQYKRNIVKHDNKIKEKENIKTRILEDKS